MIIARSTNANYLTEVSNGKERIEVDTVKEKGGSGEYYRPHELLGAAAASCMNITTRMILDQLKMAYDEVATSIELKREEKATDFIYHIEIKGNLTDQEKERVIKLAENCPVHNTLLKDIHFICKDRGEI